ncbi:MAG: SPFH domain-containing protein [Bacteroidia bacterium]
MMFGIRFARFDAMDYVIHYHNGRVRREGRGLAFFYFGPRSSIVAIPSGSRDLPFIFSELTNDYQLVIIQGQLTYKVSQPRQLAEMLDYTVDAAGQYRTDDHEKLPQRLVNEAQMATATFMQGTGLREALHALPMVEQRIREGLLASTAVSMLGVEVLGVQVLSIRPTPEMARALEAETREALQQDADQAVYLRRNFAVEQERRIRESELNTEIAVEEKQKQIAEKRMETAVVKKENEQRLRRMEMESSIDLEKQRREQVAMQAENERINADARRYVLEALLEPYRELDWKKLVALQGGQLSASDQMALAFRELAENAAKIGHLSITPDLVDTILQRK